MSSSTNDPIVENHPQDEQNANSFSIFTTLRDILIQAVVVYFIWSVFMGNRNKSGGNQKEQLGSASLSPCIVNPGDPLSIYIFLSDNQYPDSRTDSFLLLHSKELVFMQYNTGSNNDGSFVHFTQLNSSNALLNNGSLYIVACISINGFPHFSSVIGYSSLTFTCTIHELTRMIKIRKSSKKNLLSGESNNKVLENVVISHWHPNVTVNVIYDNTPKKFGHLPQQIGDYVVFTSSRDFHFPVLYVNTFWNLMSDYSPLSLDNKTLNLSLSLIPLSSFKWQMYLGAAQKNTYSIFSSEDAAGDTDMLKRTLSETNIYLIILTVVVSCAHSFFEFLAFKNDIQFWNNRKDLTGLSVTSVLFGVFQSIVVFLYIFDNETNMMVTIGCAVGCFIDAWKITKVIDIKFDHSRHIGPFPFITIKDKSSYVESSTRIYDRMALKYLSVILFPLFGCYSGYSIMYKEYKGWYSFILSLIYGFLLTFGFIMMTPQLFINYKLKSVAHLPWRMLTYKALNTFIDDIFAFVIKMPMMYRIGCLRDDVIFFVYLYQMWVYPIDKNRVNEYGTSGETESQVTNQIKSKKD